jgi:penicillin-binding protein 1A
METALKNVPIQEPSAPEGVLHIGGEWYYEEYAKNTGVSGLGMDIKTENKQPLPAADEKKKIIDLFKN